MLIPTRRLLAVALAGAVPVALTDAHDPALVVASLWLAGVLVLALVDAVFAPRRSAITWRRDHDSKLSLGAWNRVALTLTNNTARPVRWQARDPLPAWLTPEGNAAVGQLSSRETAGFNYRVFPLRRGDYQFVAIAVRYLGPLGLIWRQYSIQGDDTVKVYPNLQAVGRYETLVRRGQLAELGLRNSRRRGEGREFERLRAYTPDDEYRRIDWSATARRHEPIVIDYQVERSQPVILALDTGRLMSTRLPLPEDADTAAPNAAPRALTRLDLALNAALLLAYVSGEYGDRVGLLAFSDRVTRYLPPKAGRRQFLLITEALYNLPAESTATDYRAAVSALSSRNPRRSLIVLFTDIADVASGRELVQTAAHLIPRHLPLIVTLQDPAVNALAAMRVTDAQSVYGRAVARRVLDEREQTLRTLRLSGILTIDVPADRLSPAVINRYLEIKSRGRL